MFRPSNSSPAFLHRAPVVSNLIIPAYPNQQVVICPSNTQRWASNLGHADGIGGPPQLYDQLLQLMLTWAPLRDTLGRRDASVDRPAWRTEFENCVSELYNVLARRCADAVSESQASAIMDRIFSPLQDGLLSPPILARFFVGLRVVETRGPFFIVLDHGYERVFAIEQYHSVTLQHELAGPTLEAEGSDTPAEDQSVIWPSFEFEE